MKKHSMPEMKEGGVNVTPLIDIVMCLIIFFMLVAKIGVTRGVDQKIVLPAAILGAKIEDLGDTLTINIHARDRIAGAFPFPQVLALVNGELREIQQNQLLDILKEFKKVHAEKTKIIIRGDRNLPYAELSHVLKQMRDAQITNTAYEAARPKGEGESLGAIAAPN